MIYSTDIPVLCREERLLEARLKPYLSIFMKDEKLIKAIDAGENPSHTLQFLDGDFEKRKVKRFCNMEGVAP